MSFSQLLCVYLWALNKWKFTSASSVSFHSVFALAGEEPRFQLVGGGDTSGRLEVYHDSQWGTICGHNFGENEARAACKTLHFSR